MKLEIKHRERITDELIVIKDLIHTIQRKAYAAGSLEILNHPIAQTLRLIESELANAYKFADIALNEIERDSK